MATLTCQFHHAIQSQSGIADVTKYTGDILAGWSRGTNYDDNLNVTHYSCKLYYELPSGVYKYYGTGSINPIISAHNEYRDYYKYTWSGHADTYSNQDSSNDFDDFFKYITSRTGDFETALDPGRKTSTPFYLREEGFNIIQDNDSEYIEIIINESYGMPIGSEMYSGTYHSTSKLSTLKDIETTVCEIRFVEPLEEIVTPVYPVNVYARNDRDLTVAWNTSNIVNRSESYFYATGSTITITDSENNSISNSVVGSDTYCIFDTEDLDDLTVGECIVSVVVTTNYSNQGSAEFAFDLIGETDAPEITSVTQNSYPTISWTSTNQIAWELQISNGGGIVYRKPMSPGDDTSFTVPKLLNDGEYSIELRYMNTYGIISEWGSYYLDLEPTKPDAPENIIVSARADFGISINCDDIATIGKLLAVRRKNSNSEIEVLGEYNGSFIDYLVGLNDPHEYTVRNYVEGYADGEWIDGTLAYSGVIIRDADDYSKYAHVWMSEDKTLNYINNDERSDVLTQCVGRKYAVLDIGEWLTTERSFVGYVSNEEFKKLQKIKIESTHVLMQSQEEYFPCYMSMSDQGEYNDGRIVSFVMTRIDGEK